MCSLSLFLNEKTDYDECDKEETDCSPNALCNNTYGSYECSCKEGFSNVNAERPGRNCEGNVTLFFPISIQPYFLKNS